jgi:choice-of-anchor C domain-containing protein
MRYFFRDGRPRTNERYSDAKTGLFDSTTSVMLWHEAGIDVAVAFNGRREIEEWNWVDEVKEAINQLVQKNQLPPPPKPPTNLLQNGSFEQGPRVGDILPLSAGQTAINRWKVTRGQIDLYGTGFKAQDGGRSLDLHGSPGYGGIEQTFNTTKGQRYRVTFAMAGSPGGKIAVKRLAVRAAGKKEEFAFDATDRKPDNMGWIEYAWEFEAVAERTTLEFHTVMDSDPYFGPALDNVRVWAVPGKK